MTVISPYHRLEKKKKNNTSKSGDHASQWVFFKRGHEPYGFLAANVPIVRGKKKKDATTRNIDPFGIRRRSNGVFGYFFTNNAEVCHIT